MLLVVQSHRAHNLLVDFVRKGILYGNKIKVDIRVFAFHVMLANGEQLLGLPLRQKRKCEITDLYMFL
ncbi:hypothetical protein HanPSC8_Chr07g0297831 [Helianthus annuus]|nr:hypothetical protein HanPSC8_Chr07g0297831 [Helianthus annuus]